MDHGDHSPGTTAPIRTEATRRPFAAERHRPSPHGSGDLVPPLADAHPQPATGRARMITLLLMALLLWLGLGSCALI
jgi:hypothetical protein